MSLKKIIERITKSNIASTDEIAIIGERDHATELPGFKYFTYGDVPLIKDNMFKVVILKDPNDFKDKNLNDIFRISKRYVIFSDPFYMGAIQKTESFVESISKGGFGQVYDSNQIKKKEAGIGGKPDYVKLVSDEIKKIDSDAEATILSKSGEIISTFGDLVKKEKSKDDSFLFNFALIQNLKKQIVEREKTILGKTKDMDNLETAFKNLKVMSKKEISRLEKLLQKELNDKKIAKLKLFKEIKKRGDEIEKLKELHENKISSIDEKNDEIDKLNSEMTKLKDDHKKELALMELGQQESINKLNAKMEQAKTEYKGELNKIELQRQQSTDKLMDQMNELRQSYEKKLLFADTKKIEFEEKLNAEMDELRESYENKLSLIEAQRQESIKKLNEKMDELRESYENKLTEVTAQKQGEVRGFNAEIKELRKSYESKMTIVEFQKQELQKKLNAEVDELGTAHKKELARVETQKKKSVDDLNTKIDNLRASYENKMALIESERQNSIEKLNAEVGNLNKRLIKEKREYVKSRKKMLAGFGRELKRREDAIETLREETESQIRVLKETHEKKKKEIAVGLARKMKEMEEEFELVHFKHQEELSGKIQEMKELEKSKNNEIEKLGKELESIKSMPAYKLLSKIKIPKKIRKN